MITFGNDVFTRISHNSRWKKFYKW